MAIAKTLSETHGTIDVVANVSGATVYIDKKITEEKKPGPASRFPSRFVSGSIRSLFQKEIISTLLPKLPCSMEKRTS